MVKEEDCVNVAKKHTELLVEFFAVNNFGEKEAFCACLNYAVNTAAHGNMSTQDFESTLLGIIDAYKHIKSVGHEP